MGKLVLSGVVVVLLVALAVDFNVGVASNRLQLEAEHAHSDAKALPTSPVPPPSNASQRIVCEFRVREGIEAEAVLAQTERAAVAKANSQRVFYGYSCLARLRTDRPSCRRGGSICSERPWPSPSSHWLTRVENRAYSPFEFAANASSRSSHSSGGSLGAEMSKSLGSSFDPVDKYMIPVLGFVVLRGATLLKRGLLSVDFPVGKLMVVQMGDDAEVSAVLDDLKANYPQLSGLIVVKLPKNLGCAAGWNRIIIENLAAPYWFIVNFDIAFPPGALKKIHLNASWVSPVVGSSLRPSVRPSVRPFVRMPSRRRLFRLLTS